jgi:gliding motility-associated-like protein
MKRKFHFLLPRHHSLVNFLLMLFSISGITKAEKANQIINEKVTSWINTSSEKGFIENRGQMSDNFGNPVPYVLFKTEAPNVNIWITETGMTIQTLVVRKEEIAESEMTEIERQESKQAHKPKKRKFMDWERIDLEFKGAVIKKENILKENPGETDFNFFYGHCQSGIYGVKEYQKITIKNIYPNIDWVIYRKKEGEIKYDFIVHAGADYKQIELIYKSKNQINLNEEGQLEFTTKYGDILEKKPVSFCQNNTISTQFKLNYQKQHMINGDNGFESSFSFNFENFNASSTEDLIIDPDLVWSTFYGGNYLDGPTSIDTDQDGNIFVTGYVASSNFPTLNALGGSYFQGTFGLGSDVMLLKFNNAGLRLWATYYGGSGGDRGWFVTTDVNGYVYVTGDTEGPDFPVLDAGAGAYFQDTVKGQLDVFVLKFSNSGVLQFGTCFGGNGLDFGFSISVDSNGNFYVTGLTSSTDLPTLDMGAGSYYQANIGGAAAFNSFLIKFNSAGVLIWSTYYGGDTYEIGYGIANDAVGNVFMVGKSESSDFPLLNAGGSSYFQSNGGIGNSNAYVVKFSNTGVRLWATSLGGSSIDEALTVIADANGDIIITGISYSNNFPLLDPGAGAYFQGTFGGVIDIFIARFTNTGTQLWSTYFGGASGEYQSCFDNLALDSCGNVYMTMWNAINDIPLQAQCEGGYFDSLYNGTDVILVMFSNTGKVLWSTYIGGNGLDFQGAIAVDQNKNVFISGEWCGNSVNNSTYPLVNAGGGSYFDGTFNGGGDDGFVLKFAPTIPIISTNIIQPSCADLCGGEATVNISNSCTFNYLWSNGQTTQTATGLCPGNYTVHITNPICGGLDTIIQISIIAPPTSVTPNFAGLTSFCVGDSIPTLPLTSINNVTGTWSPALDNMATTTYTFTPSIGQCALDTQLTIQINPLPIANAISNSPVCQNQTLNLNGNATTGATYSWIGPNSFSSSQQNTSISNVNTTMSGDYILTIFANGCNQSDTINISVLPSIFVNQTVQICAGQSYVLPNGSTTDTSGVFVNVLINANGCDSTISTTVTQVNTFSININSQTCAGQNFLLPDGSTTAAAGLYTFNFLSAAGCDSLITVNLALAIPNLDTINAQICNGQTYILPDGNSVNATGIYDVVLQNQNGCDSIITTMLNAAANLIASVQIMVSPNDTICEGNTAIFSASYFNEGTSPQFQWFINGIIQPGEINDSLIISNIQSNDTISVTMNSDLICVANTLVNSNAIAITVLQNIFPTLSITSDKTIVCELEQINFDANAIDAGLNLVYYWYLNGALVQSDTSNVFSFNTFNDNDSVCCKIMPNYFCTGATEVISNTLHIQVNPNPEIDMITYEYWQYLGDSIQLTSSTNIINPIYNWSANAYLSCFDCLNPNTTATDTTLYFLTITDKNTGCFTNDSVIVYVLEDFDIFLPTGFSPNDDNVNDILFLRGHGIKEFELNIYDRWGALIFSSNSLLIGWDGTYKGKAALNGTYVYTLEYTNMKKEVKFLKGNLTLIR